METEKNMPHDVCRGGIAPGNAGETAKSKPNSRIPAPVTGTAAEQDMDELKDGSSPCDSITVRPAAKIVHPLMNISVYPN